MLLNAGLLKTNDIINISDTRIIADINDHDSTVDTKEDTFSEKLKQAPNNLINFFETEF